jgi:hypothetical protein
MNLVVPKPVILSSFAKDLIGHVKILHFVQNASSRVILGGFPQDSSSAKDLIG